MRSAATAQNLGGSSVDDIVSAGEDAGASAVVMAYAHPRQGPRQMMHIAVVEVASGRIVTDTMVVIGQNRRRGRRRGARWVPQPAAATRALSGALSQISVQGGSNQGGSDQGGSNSGGGSDWGGGGGGNPSWASSGDSSSNSVSSTVSRRSRRKANRARGMGYLSVGFEAKGRLHEYEDPRTSNLRPYQVLGAPGGIVSGRLYPLAWLRKPGFLGDIAIEGEYTQAVALVSSPQDATDVVIETQWTGWDAGGAIRLDFSPVIVSVSGGIGTLAFNFVPPEDFTQTDELPDVSYAYARGGLGLHLDLRSFGIFASGSYLHMLASGRVGDEYFANSQKLGLRGKVGATVALFGGIELLVAGRYTQILYQLNAEEDDKYVAGAAIDRHFGLEAGLAYVF